MGKANGQREVVAHFSRSRIASGAVGLLVMTVLGVIMCGHVLLTGKTDDWVMHMFRIDDAVTFVGCMAILFILMFRTIRTAIDNHGEAIWLEDGRLTCADKALLDVPAGDVKGVDVVREPIYGTRSPWPPHMTNLVFYLKDGKAVKISPGGFVEHPGDIADRLREKLGLARDI
ncbi:MAG TPA: hypothetical protein VJL82_06540 [Rhizomicrobium sp.]|nr:hypothetical protein [Rhizomicrobium sp.]